MKNAKPRDTPTGKDAKDAKDADAVEERSTPPTPVIYEVVRRLGEEEMARPWISLWWSGVAAGLSISFSLLAQGVIDMRLPETSWAPLAIAAGYPMGFLMVVLGRQQLFTESTITMVLPVMAAPTGANFSALGRSWSIILAANLAGTLMAALFCTFTPVISPELREAMLELSRHALEKPWSVLFFEAITAGFLMAAMVWLLPGAERAQFQVVALMTYLIAISGSAHIVAGSIEAFLLLVNGRTGLWDATFHFALPVLLGNIVGGTALFAMLSHAQVMREL